MGDLGETPLSAAPGQHGDDVDGLGNQGAGHRDDGLLHELLKPAQRSESRVGVYGTDAAGVPCPPCFEQVERFAAAHLSNWNAIRPQPQRGLHQIGERGDAILRPKCDKVRRGALQLARVLDNDDAIRALRDFGVSIGVEL